MIYRIAADMLVVLHALFICFVVLGGLWVFRRRWLIALHLPAVAWGVLIELNGWICPLTPLEQALRRAAGAAGYRGGFIDHYLTPLIYPLGLDPTDQLAMAAFVGLVNLGIYTWLYFRRSRRTG